MNDFIYIIPKDYWFYIKPTEISWNIYEYFRRSSCFISIYFANEIHIYEILCTVVMKSLLRLPDLFIEINRNISKAKKIEKKHELFNI